MSDRLAAAVREVRLVCSGLTEVVRADIDDAGVLMLTALDDGKTRWFTLDDRGLIERQPEHDSKLPLAARLRLSQDWRVLSYRPGRRVVVHVQHGEQAGVLKGHKKSRSARAAVHQGMAEETMRRGAFRVPRLLQHDGQHEALVFEFLDAREVELGVGCKRHYARLGELLAVFQGDENATILKPFTALDELEVLERWRGKVEAATGSLPPGWLQARALLAERARTLPTPGFGLCHRDLHDRQVHLVGDSIALFDFDLLCRADVALDPGNLVAHLRWRGLQGLHGADPAGIGALEEAFLGGLGRSGEPGFAARLDFYTASAFLRLALVYRLRPRWSARVPDLISWAGTAMDDLAHRT